MSRETRRRARENGEATTQISSLGSWGLLAVDTVEADVKQERQFSETGRRMTGWVGCT